MASCLGHPVRTSSEYFAGSNKVLLTFLPSESSSKTPQNSRSVTHSKSCFNFSASLNFIFQNIILSLFESENIILLASFRKSIFWIYNIYKFFFVYWGSSSVQVHWNSLTVIKMHPEMRPQQSSRIRALTPQFKTCYVKTMFWVITLLRCIHHLRVLLVYLRIFTGSDLIN